MNDEQLMSAEIFKKKRRRKFSKDLSNWPRGFAAFGTIVEQVRLSVIWATPISTGET